MQESSRVATQLAASQAGLSSRKLVLVSYATECIASFFLWKTKIVASQI
jgi:hypothetical protein